MKTYLDEEIRKLQCPSSGFQGPVPNPTINHISPPQPTQSDEGSTLPSKPLNLEPSTMEELERSCDLSARDESVGNNEVQLVYY